MRDGINYCNNVFKKGRHRTQRFDDVVERCRHFFSWQPPNGCVLEPDTIMRRLSCTLSLIDDLLFIECVRDDNRPNLRGRLSHKKQAWRCVNHDENQEVMKGIYHKPFPLPARVRRLSAVWRVILPWYQGMVSHWWNISSVRASSRSSWSTYWLWCTSSGSRETEARSCLSY